MKNHVFRPLWVAIGLVALVLIVRQFVVPSDFGVHGRNFTYGYYRSGNVDEWKNFPVKYGGRDLCADCHEEKNNQLNDSKHRTIQCENCHGPVLNHPEEPEKLVIDTSRELCLRCHAFLPYPTSQRSLLPGIDSVEHNPGSVCSECHNPHKPALEDM